MGQEIANQVKVFAPKAWWPEFGPQDSYIWEGENQLYKVSSNLHTCTVTHAYTPYYEYVQ